MFFQFILTMLLGLVSPSTTNTNCNPKGDISVMQGEPITGGDTGQNPPPK
ncbi:hypothetical protein HDF26_002235 [Pedobacter cryoconitis]|nr:hypothetical protein [Pedobacter cryoconitis]MBB6271778.1 hypothetical protein [Pedobacter cryoconitis]